MQLYDLIFLAILVVFGFWGFASGAVRQVINLASFFLAIAIAGMSRGFVAKAFHLDALTSSIAAVILFLVVFIGIRYLGHALSDKIHKQKALGYIDRFLGVGIGVVWTLMIIGVFHLLFSLVTPIERQPAWFREAKVYSLSVQCAKTIQAFLPKGVGAADRVAEES